jgi:hypothetical protein
MSKEPAPPAKTCPIMSRVCPVPGQLNTPGNFHRPGDGNMATVSFPLVQIPCLRAGCVFWSEDNQDCDMVNNTPLIAALQSLQPPSRPINPRIEEAISKMTPPDAAAGPG